MSNSKLVTYTAWTSHYGYSGAKEGRGGKKIDKIFVHHMAGNLTVKQCGNVFKTREASAHYGINGKNIGQYVDEKNAAWHCGNKSYNQRSIGIECANDGGASTNWHVSNTTIQTLITLLVDICQRNGIKKLNYTGDLKGNLCMHCWTQSTACPGGYLKSKFKYIASEVNKKLSGSKPTPAPSKELYRVRKSWNDPKSQVGAFEDLQNAKNIADKYGYNVYNSQGKNVYSGRSDTQLYRVRKSWADEKSQKGAFKSLTSAKNYCDKFVGYHVYDNDGKLVYTSTKKEETKPQTYSDIMKPLMEACKAQSIWMKNYIYKWQPKPTIAKSKEKGTCVTYQSCVLQRIGVLKSGQYIWHNGNGYGKGKVTGDVNKDYMTVSYMKNKTLSSLKTELREGDIIMVDDNKSGKKGDGGHIFTLTGDWKGNDPYIWDNNTAKKGQKPLLYNGKRKVLARVRLKNFRVTVTITNGLGTETQNYLAAQDVKIVYKPNGGKVLKSVTVDGKAVDIKKYASAYMFKDIKKNHTVKIVYA